MSEDVKGKNVESARAAEVAKKLSDSVDQLSENSSLKATASNLESSIETMQAKFIKQLQAGGTDNVALNNVMKQVEDVFKAREAILAASSKQMDTMKSALAQVAASVGMSVTEFEAQLVAATAAMKEFEAKSATTISSAVDGATETTAVTGSALTEQLQREALSATLAAQSSGQAIDSVTASLLAANGDAAASASKQADRAMSQLLGGSTQLSVAGSQVLDRVASQSTAIADSSAKLSDLLKSTQAAGASLTANIASVDSSGKQSITVAGDSIGRAFGLILSLLAGFLKTEQGQIDFKLHADTRASVTSVENLLDSASKALHIVKLGAERVSDAVKVTTQLPIDFPDYKATGQTVSEQIAAKQALNLAASVDFNKVLTADLGASELELQTEQSAATNSVAAMTTALGSVAKVDSASLDEQVDALKLEVAKDVEAANSQATSSMADISAARITFTKDNIVTTNLREKQTGKDATFAADRESASKVANAAAISLDESFQATNSTLVSSVSSLSNFAARKATAIRESASKGAAELAAAMTTQTSELNRLITVAGQAPTIEGTVDSQESSKEVAKVVKSVIAFEPSLETHVAGVLAKESDLTNAQILVPVFATTNALADYGANLADQMAESGMLMQERVGTSTDVLGGYLATAKASRSQSSTALAANEADARLKVLGSDIENKMNLQIASATVNTSKLLVSKLEHQISDLASAHRADQDAAAQQMAFLNATWQAEVASTESAVSVKLADSTAEVVDPVTAGVRSVMQNTIADITSQWSRFQSSDLITLSKVSDTARTTIQGMTAATQAGTSKSVSIIADAVKEVRDLTTNLGQFRASGKALADFPKVADASLTASSDTLNGLEGPTVTELVENADALVKQRRESAAENVMKVYLSVKNFIKEEESTTGRLLNIVQNAGKF